MATGNSFPGLSDLDRALPSISPSSRGTAARRDSAPQELQLKVLLWNIHGDTSEGMAEARKMLVEEVVKKTASDIVLLQEVTAMETARRAQQKSLPQRSYVCHLSRHRSRSRIFEAGIMYDTNSFECGKVISIIEVVGSSNLSGLAAPERESRSGQTRLTRDQEYYSDRTCALRLCSKRDRREFVVVSFHNGRRDTAPNTLGFVQLMELIYQQEKVPVIVGGDFNCDCRGLRSPDLLIPDYTSSDRRRTDKKIDFFVMRKPHPPTTIMCRVKVFEALPLVDPTSTDADTHPLGRAVLRRLVEEAPMKKKERRRLLWQEFNRVSNHDPTIGVITIHSGQ